MSSQGTHSLAIAALFAVVAIASTVSSFVLVAFTPPRMEPFYITERLTQFQTVTQTSSTVSYVTISQVQTVTSVSYSHPPYQYPYPNYGNYQTITGYLPYQQQSSCIFFYPTNYPNMVYALDNLPSSHPLGNVLIYGYQESNYLNSPCGTPFLFVGSISGV